MHKPTIEHFRRLYELSRSRAYGNNNKPQQSYWEGALRALLDIETEQAYINILAALPTKPDRESLQSLSTSQECNQKAVKNEHKANGWHHINTAPKDGTPVDIWANGERFADCHWTGKYWFTPHGIYDCGAEMELHGISPTHWTQIPKAPIGQEIAHYAIHEGMTELEIAETIDKAISETNKEQPDELGQTAQDKVRINVMNVLVPGYPDYKTLGELFGENIIDKIISTVRNSDKKFRAPERESSNDAQNAARYLYLKGNHSSRLSMTQEQPMECGIYYEFQQSKPHEAGWNLDRCIDADIDRQNAMDTETTDIEDGSGNG